MFATSDQSARAAFLGMTVSERKGFIGVSALHLKNARTALSQIYERNGMCHICMNALLCMMITLVPFCYIMVTASLVHPHPAKHEGDYIDDESLYIT